MADLATDDHDIPAADQHQPVLCRQRSRRQTDDVVVAGFERERVILVRDVDEFLGFDSSGGDQSSFDSGPDTGYTPTLRADPRSTSILNEAGPFLNLAVSRAGSKVCDTALHLPAELQVSTGSRLRAPAGTSRA